MTRPRAAPSPERDIDIVAANAGFAVAGSIASDRVSG